LKPCLAFIQALPCTALHFEFDSATAQSMVDVKWIWWRQGGTDWVDTWIDCNSTRTWVACTTFIFSLQLQSRTGQIRRSQFLALSAEAICWTTLSFYFTAAIPSVASLNLLFKSTFYPIALTCPLTYTLVLLTDLCAEVFKDSSLQTPPVLRPKPKFMLNFKFWCQSCLLLLGVCRGAFKLILAADAAPWHRRAMLSKVGFLFRTRSISLLSELSVSCLSRNYTLKMTVSY
jgi:hypothetical protein